MPPAGLADHLDRGQELHVDTLKPRPAAFDTSPPIDIETEAGRSIPSRPGLRQPGKELSDEGEDFRIGGRIGAGAPADGRLVDASDLVDELMPRELADFTAGAGLLSQLAQERRMEDLVDQGAFSRTGHPGDDDHALEGDLDVAITEVVAGHPFEAEGFSPGLPDFCSPADFFPSGEIVTGQ